MLDKIKFMDGVLQVQIKRHETIQEYDERIALLKSVNADMRDEGRLLIVADWQDVPNFSSVEEKTKEQPSLCEEKLATDNQAAECHKFREMMVKRLSETPEHYLITPKMRLVIRAIDIYTGHYNSDNYEHPKAKGES